jgi:methylated-DNA-[protein]-cysteine S-methyltransferase
MSERQTFELSRVPTPMGTMLVVTDRQGKLRALDWETHIDRMHELLRRVYGSGTVQLVDGAGTGPVFDKLKAYFDGDLHAIEEIPIETGGTPFQREVWAALREIPAGKSWSYGQLAKHIGHPTAVRAVGLANGSNPIGLVVPCHRVVGADGSLTGYGGGLDRKEWLLRHEASCAGTGA